MKLIELLVKELPHRGDWPEGVDTVRQNCKGQLFEIDSDYCSDFKLETCDDWITDVVTKQQYESAMAASKAVVGRDGWIQWAGGECPVDSDAVVEVKFRNPNPYQINNDRAGDFTWSHHGFDGDIIAYRLQNPGIGSRANDDLLEQDLNECIGQDVDMAEWMGDGLPPVGTICQAKVHRSITGWEWRKVKVVESGIPGAEKEVLVYDLETTIPSWADEFRPLRNEAERKREAAAKEMARHANSDPHRKFNAGLRNCLSIYDAIAAGKIPGVKLEVK